MRYRIFDSVVDSDVPLPELAPSRASRSDIRVQLRGPRERRSEAGWSIEEDEPWLTVGRRGGEWRLRFSDAVDFFVSDGGNVVRAAAPARFPDDSLRHLLVDQVLPLVLSARGRLILHGSAVRSPWGGILLLARSGGGKSTLAVTLARDGWKLLSDDYVRIRLGAGSAVAVAAYPGARLWPDVLGGIAAPSSAMPRVSHYSAKRRLRRDALRGRTALASPLRRIYLLEESAGVSVRSVSMRDALVALLSHTLRLGAAGGRDEGRRLELLGRLSETVGVRRLSYPRVLGQLARVKNALARDLAAAAGQEMDR